jgi:hypothetical protein
LSQLTKDSLVALVADAQGLQLLSLVLQENARFSADRTILRVADDEGIHRLAASGNDEVTCCGYVGFDWRIDTFDAPPIPDAEAYYSVPKMAPIFEGDPITVVTRGERAVTRRLGRDGLGDPRPLAAFADYRLSRTVDAYPDGTVAVLHGFSTDSPYLSHLSVAGSEDPPKVGKLIYDDDEGPLTPDARALQEAWAPREDGTLPVDRGPAMPPATAHVIPGGETLTVAVDEVS